MGVKIDPDGAFLAKLARFEGQMRRETAKLAAKAAQDAQQLALLALQNGVYGTVAGLQYVRTGALKGSVRVRQGANANVAWVEVASSLPYATYIEHGTGPGALSDRQIDAYAAQFGEQAQIVRLGRSGRRYMVPQPFVRSTAATISRLMLRRFLDAAGRAWGGQGR